MEGVGADAVGRPGHPAPSPHLEDPFAKFVKLWGPGFPVPPSPYPPPPPAPDFMSLLISTTAASERGRNPAWGPSLPCLPASPRAFFIHCTCHCFAYCLSPASPASSAP
uniref:Uncharacterized protein n=1 Tax=Ursus americanus TaxID=9643 RepID=A0A452RVD6_URSAM